jgi:hypothetical protein
MSVGGIDNDWVGLNKKLNQNSQIYKSHEKALWKSNREIGTSNK